MRIKVYQIDNKLDRYDTGFRSYDSVMKVAGELGFDGYFQGVDSASKKYTPDF